MKKRNFSAEFKRESAQLVVDQNYTVADAASAMDVGLSTMTRWVKQLRDERQGKTPKASPITPEQIEIRELRKKLQRIEMENEILKKATVDSICQCAYSALFDHGLASKSDQRFASIRSTG
ncbi:transposase, partial [Escherichia coli]|uniref:transposase n=1 Tax=Escherichia coli TaxID=562 RepID=UPI00202369ED